jgi:hypothetical protein
MSHPSPPVRAALSEFVGSLSTSIVRRADRYVELLEAARMPDEHTAPPVEISSTAEKDLLERFQRFTADVLLRYLPPGPRKNSGLVFEHLYRPATPPRDSDAEHATVAALLAAETEFRGPLKLTQAQIVLLAQTFENLGDRLRRSALPLHAEFAFDRAGSLYLQVADHPARDHCLLAASRARHRARGWGWRSALETISDVLCGYGYQPYRLLAWVCVQLAVLCIILTLFSDQTAVNSAHLVLTNYLNPLGPGDTVDMPYGVWVALTIESYAGSVSLSVFFALVVRRWFRL